MIVKDKQGLLKNMRSISPIILDIGCGNRKRVGNSIGIDQIDNENVDIVGDVYDILPLIPDCCVDAVYSFHFFEHVTNIVSLMNELSRIIKKGGLLKIVVPHFSNPYFYSDYTHKTFFGLYSFSYLAKDNLLQRKTPLYGRLVDFELKDIHLIFKSSPPFYIRHTIKVVLGKFFDLNIYTREIYEEFFCWIFPCYEIDFLMIKM